MVTVGCCRNGAIAMRDEEGDVSDDTDETGWRVHTMRASKSNLLDSERVRGLSGVPLPGPLGEYKASSMKP